MGDGVTGGGEPLDDVVIITGAPGAGKTTVARLLAGSGERTVHLEADCFHRFVSAGFVPPHLPEAHDQNVRIMGLSADNAAAYSRAGYQVFWDGIVGPWFLDLVLGRLAGSGLGANYLILDLPEEMTVARVSERDRTSEVSGARLMARQFAAVTGYDDHLIDGSGSPVEVAARCRSVIEGGRTRLSADPWTDPGWPVSVKAALQRGDRFVVVRNKRGEWELPGGRIDATDLTPRAALRRELLEELSIEVSIGPLIDSWFHPGLGGRVVIMVHHCHAPESFGPLVASEEHVEIGLLTVEELRDQPIPGPMLESLRRAKAGS